MRKLAALLVVSVLSVATAIGLASCGSSSSDSGGKEGGTLIGTYAGFPDYLDPALSYTQEGWTAMYDTYIPLLTYAHESNEAGSKVVPGPRHGHAEDHQRRQDLHADAPEGPQILRRDPDQGVRLQVRGRTDDRAQLRRLALLHGIDRRRRTVPEDQAGADFRDQDERQDRGNRHQSDRTARDLHQRARVDVRRAASPRHPDQEPLRRPATGERALRDRQLRPGPGLEVRPQPRMAGEQRETAARPPERPRRQDRHQDHPQHLHPGQRSRTGHHPVDAGPDPTRHLPENRQPVRRDPAARGARDPQRLLLLDEHDAGALRRPQGARSGQLRGQP